MNDAVGSGAGGYGLIRMVSAEMLGELGCDVTEAGSAEDGLALLERERFDILVSDLGLPGMSRRGLVVRFADGCRQWELYLPPDRTKV